MRNKNYYEILGVGSHVGSGQIQAAYRFARSLYSGEATATYGLLDSDERVTMLALVEEAYAALSNPNARRDYDIHLGSRGGGEGGNFPVTVAPPTGSTKAPERQRTDRTASVASVPTEVTAPPPPLKVPDNVDGAVLKTLREARGMSIDQIAALSKVGGRFLKALEEDRHSALPGRVFARGFLIEYARAIRVSETEIVERYLRQWAVL